MTLRALIVASALTFAAHAGRDADVHDVVFRATTRPAVRLRGTTHP